jgi:hypothetical protein
MAELLRPIAATLEHATNFLSFAQSQPSSGPLLVAHRALGWSLMPSVDYRAALAHLETAASLYRPDEHRDSALHYGQDIGVSAFVCLSWALWHRGYPDQSARAADRALAYSPVPSSIRWRMRPGIIPRIPPPSILKNADDLVCHGSPYRPIPLGAASASARKHIG